MVRVKRQPRGQRLMDVHLRLPLALLETVEALARKAGVSLSEYLRRVIEAHAQRGGKDAD